MMKTETIRIGGMTCVNCRNLIERKLGSTAGVAKVVVSFNNGIAVVTYDTVLVTMKEITDAIEGLGYKVLDGKARTPLGEIIGTLTIILALYALLRGLGVGGLTSAFPLATAGTSYGMLFIIGLITSVHCVAMCGGINLSQTISSQTMSKGGALLPSVLYNGARVLSYTVVGIIAGALGQAFTISGRFQGAVQLVAGVFMAIMGLNMIGVFPSLRRFSLRLPSVFSKGGQKAARKSPLVIGLLNGLMPCGPLQAMQLYALSTGSPVAGGVSMFLFSIGTIPLMFGIGALGGVLSSASRGPAFVHRVMKVGGILVTVMGMTMFTYGYRLSGLNFDGMARTVTTPRTTKTDDQGFTPMIENGVQVVNSTLSGGRYPAITVQQGVPVKWTIDAPQGSINGCNNRMIIREYKIEHQFKVGENVIEFTPDKAGRFPYSCWMGMIRSSITVVEEGLADIGEPKLESSPAGVTIPTDAIALAEIQEAGYQTVAISLHDDGIEPAVLVVQRNIPTLWIVNNDSLDPGNNRLVFPIYYAQVDMEQGENTIRLLPTEDFDFSTGDNVFYGFVKVVDDLENVDIEVIKAQVDGFETLIYPDASFGCFNTSQWALFERVRRFH
jgi:sulfite exporter TauE/SafE/copper chaperone CopZ/plastocyanin domain-containing protein